MKAIISILLFIIITAFTGGKEYDSNSVMTFVYENLGKKVGTGLCHDFVVQAEDTKYTDWNTDYYLSGRMGERQVYYSDLAKGDVMLIDGVVFNGAQDTVKHIGIFMGKLDGVIVFASQNLGEHGDTENIIDYKGEMVSIFDSSKVVLSTIDLKAISYGRVYFFRF